MVKEGRTRNGKCEEGSLRRSVSDTIRFLPFPLLFSRLRVSHRRFSSLDGILSFKKKKSKKTLISILNKRKAKQRKGKEEEENLPKERPPFKYNIACMLS